MERRIGEGDRKLKCEKYIYKSTMKNRINIHGKKIVIKLNNLKK